MAVSLSGLLFGIGIAIALGSCATVLADGSCPSQNPAASLLEPILGISQQISKPLFQSCYSANRAEIPASVLAKLYKTAREDPLTHMKTPEIHCLHRAYLLMAYLYRKG